MSRRRKEEPILSAPPPDRFRRILLGAVTAILVARPVVAGEDPGRLRWLESTSGQTLNLLWLFVAVAASLWLTRSSRRLSIGPIPAALAVFSLLAAVSTAVVPCYRHPAWLIVSEWLQLPIIFLLVRELAADEDPKADSAGGLLSAMLASMISVAGYAVYQAVASVAGWPVPDLPRTASTGPVSVAEFFHYSESLSSSAVIRGTFENPDSLAAVILLLLPAIGGYAFFGQGWRAKTAGLMLPLCAAVLILAIRSQARMDYDAPRLTRLGVAADLASQRPIFGVGAGNLERHAPRFVAMNPDSLREPADSWLTLAATSGVPAALLLAGTIIIAIRLAFRVRNESGIVEKNGAEQPRWEFYLGGVAGLLLGLLLRTTDYPVAEDPRRILHLGFAAGGRALIWFLAFALFDGLHWRRAARRYALAAGLAGVALFGIISPALLQPVLMQTFWAIAALASAGSVQHVEAGQRNFRWLTIPAACGLAGAYFLLVWDPAFQGTGHLRDARRAGRLYAGKLYEYRTLPPPDQRRRAKDYRQFVENMILNRMESSVAADKNNLALVDELAQWQRRYWNDLYTDGKLENRALELVQSAHALDPNGVESLLTELQLRLTFARLRLKYGSQPLPAEQENEIQRRLSEHFRACESLILEIAQRAPALESRSRLRFLQALLNAGNDERKKFAEQQARRILELDDAPNLPWKLNASQRALALKVANRLPE